MRMEGIPALHRTERLFNTYAQLMGRVVFPG